MVHRALQMAASVQVWSIEHPRDGKTIITSKCVDHHGASCIPGLRTGKYSNGLQKLSVVLKYFLTVFLPFSMIMMCLITL